MGRGINRFIGIGIVSEKRGSKKDPSYQRFVLTTEEKYTKSDGEQVTTSGWVRVVTQPGAQVVEDGDTVVIVGRIVQSVYTKDGIESKRTEISASERLALVPNETPHFNEVLWTGRMAADPELSYTSSGAAVCKMRSMTGDTYTDKGGTVHDTTCGVNMTVWRGLGEMCARSFHKGMIITGTGRVASRTYTSREGDPREATDITMLDVQLPPKSAQPVAVTAGPDVEDDDLPF
jgi:single-strand DNA-binding protein